MQPNEKPSRFRQQTASPQERAIDAQRAINWFCCAVTAIFIVSQPCAAEVILPFGSSWEYLHPLDGIDPAIADADFGTTSHTPVSYDGAIFSGPAPAMLGYGEIEDQSIATDISTPPIGLRFAAYFRTTITTTSDYDWLKFEIMADDGGVLYIDGEIAAILNYAGEDYYAGLALAVVPAPHRFSHPIVGSVGFHETRKPLPAYQKHATAPRDKLES